MKFFFVAAFFLSLKITTSYFTYFSTSKQSMIATLLSTSNFNYCGDLTCLNNGICKIRGNGQTFCMCKRGYTGYTCGEDVDECRSRYPCFHRGMCQNTIGNYRCVCFEGWLGENLHCEIKDNSTTVRVCAKGWFGEWCMDQCFNDSMCRSNEVCVMRNTGLISYRGHQCRCAPGWYGIDCSIDKNECLRNPCLNNVTCINTPGSFKCSCKPGWNGRNCNEDVDECSAFPCQNSSNCTNTIGSYICTCAEGWKGIHCDGDIDECAINPCNESTNCENVPGSFTCSEKSDRDIYTIIGAVIGLLFLIGCLVFGLNFIKRKSRKCNATIDSQLEDKTNYHQRQSNNENSNKN